MKKNIVAFALFIWFITASQYAAAEGLNLSKEKEDRWTKKLYVSGGWGRTHLNIPIKTKTEDKILAMPGVTGTLEIIKDSDFQTLSLGYQAWKTTAFEFFYADGIVFRTELNASNPLMTVTGRRKADVTATGLFVKKNWPVGESFQLFGKIGYIHYKAKIQAEIHSSVAVDGLTTMEEDDSLSVNSPAMALGMSYKLGKGVKVQAETAKDAATRSWLIGMTFNF